MLTKSIQTEIFLPSPVFVFDNGIGLLFCLVRQNFVFGGCLNHQHTHTGPRLLKKHRQTCTTGQKTKTTQNACREGCRLSQFNQYVNDPSASFLPGRGLLSPRDTEQKSGENSMTRPRSDCSLSVLHPGLNLSTDRGAQLAALALRSQLTCCFLFCLLLRCN